MVLFTPTNQSDLYSPSYIDNIYNKHATLSYLDYRLLSYQLQFLFVCYLDVVKFIEKRKVPLFSL